MENNTCSLARMFIIILCFYIYQIEYQSKFAAKTRRYSVILCVIDLRCVRSSHTGGMVLSWVKYVRSVQVKQGHLIVLNN